MGFLEVSSSDLVGDDDDGAGPGFSVVDTFPNWNFLNQSSTMLMACSLLLGLGLPSTLVAAEPQLICLCVFDKERVMTGVIAALL